MDRLQEKYINEVVPALTEKFGYKNVMELPKIAKDRKSTRLNSSHP